MPFYCPQSITTAAAAQIVPPQNSKPAATAKVDTIPAARDVAYPGTMQLTVDASDVTRAIFKVHEHVPVSGAGDFVMLYPEWLPGNTSPRDKSTRSRASARPPTGAELKWVRDNLDVYAFHIAVPAGRERDRRRLPISFADRGRPGARRRHSRPREHRVDRQFDVSRGLFRPRYPGPGLGDRSSRLEGRDRASSERPERAAGSTIR